MFGKTKKHFSDHKELYLGFGLGATAVFSAYFIGCRRNPVEVAQKVVQVAFRAEAKPVLINLVERSTPSKPVHLVGTDLFFSSIHEAAKKTGHAVSKISKNVNGHIPDINGDVFEVLQPA